MGRRPLERFLQLPARDRSLLLWCATLLAAARIALWGLPFRTVRRWIARLARRLRSGETTPARVAWAIALAKRVVPGATCLPQALVAEALLVAAGQPAELRIGVQKTAAGKLEAHAWVESGGRMIVGDLSQGLSGYTPLPPLPPHPNAGR